MDDKAKRASSDLKEAQRTVKKKLNNRMDRGRCGYDLVGNKFLREKAVTIFIDIN